MTKYVKACRHCGELFKAKLRKRLVFQRETERGKFTSDDHSRYYCDECTELAIQALDAFDGGGQR